MIFFMKKQKKDEEDIREIKDAVEGKIPPEKKVKRPKRKEPETFEEHVEEYEPVKLEKPPMPTATGNVPLFVKIEKYKNVLSVLNEMKTTIMMLKNALTLEQELEKARNENITLIQNAVGKIERKILAMDAEFLRPSGYKEQLPEQVYEAESLDYAVDTLKSQIDELKSELEEV